MVSYRCDHCQYGRICGVYCCTLQSRGLSVRVPLFPGSDEEDDEPFPIWKGMSTFEAGESEAPPAGVIIVDPFCDYLGKRCIQILEEAGYAVVQASGSNQRRVP